MAPGLRERRKQKTRQDISAVAMALFAERGFDKVTIAQVAEAAGVSKMTVTNYFARKEDLVFDRAEEIIRGLAEAVARRPPGESVLAAVRRDYHERLAAGDVTLGPPTATFARMIEDSHVLATRWMEIASQGEQALAGAIEAETGIDDIRHRIIAAQLASVHRVLFKDSVRRVLAGDPPAEIRRTLAAEARRAFDLLEPSLGDYGIRTSG
ncbi:MAG: TetR/AcrR family transcriptional regulator [Streptosporangiaceae bacterium]